MCLGIVHTCSGDGIELFEVERAGTSLAESTIASLSILADDINKDLAVNLLDVAPFVELLSNQ